MKIYRALLAVIVLVVLSTGALASNPITLYQLTYQGGSEVLTSSNVPFPNDETSLLGHGYKLFSDSHKIDGTASGSLVLLIVLDNPTTGDTFYTTSNTTATVYESYGYIRESYSPGWVSTGPMPGYIPFYYAYHSASAQHFFGDKEQISQLGPQWTKNLTTPAFYVCG